MATSQDAHSACGIDTLADDLQPEMTQLGSTVKLESNAPYSTASASSQRPATTKRKGTEDLALTSGAPVDVASYFAELNQAFNDVDGGRDEAEQHDPNSEPVPPLQQYTQAFLQAEKKASDTVRRVSEYVKDEPEQDSESLYMHERFVTIRHPAYPATVRVAISRNSGIGKSTLINATLGLPTLCSTSDTDAGTLVPIEIVHTPADQPKKYAFYVDSLSLENRNKIIKWAVKDYYDSCDDDEFANDEVAAEYPGTLNSADDPHSLSQMLGWTHDIYQKLLAYISKGTLFASTAIELAEVVEPFILSTESPMIRLDEFESLECCVWPFVRLARISFPHPTLAKNIIFADLPGLTDTNTHRLIKIEQTKVQHLLKASRSSNNPGYGLVAELCHKEALYKLHIKHAEIMKKQIAVAARNRQVTTDLQSFYRRETRDPNDFRVFCNLPKQIRQAKKDFWTTQVLETVLRQIDLHEAQWLEKAENFCIRWSKYNPAPSFGEVMEDGKAPTCRLEPRSS
ncbi:hypothetical protein E8E11_002072 [Didymella keratinophila]|nr:hypothetical protein E8E11_002072 [Didymella keratinophila]